VNESEQQTTPEPVVAEVVSEPQGAPRFRFGLRAMLALVAICGLQFALMSYLGSFWGLLLGLAFCWSLLCVLLVIAILLHRRKHEPFMIHLNRWAIPVTLAIVILSVSVMAAGGGWVVYDAITRGRMVSRLKDDLGFRSRRTHVIRDAVMVEAILVRSVARGEPFESAGVKKGDVIIVERSVNDFFEVMEENRGGSVTITVAADAENQDVKNCVARQLDVSVPKP